MARVLLVDDTKIVHQLVRIHLTGLNLEFDDAYNGQEALDLLNENRYDVVISDLNMPGLDGIALCKKIKSNPRHALTNVILLTSNTAADTRVAAIGAGCAAFLEKPIDQSALVSTVKKHACN